VRLARGVTWLIVLAIPGCGAENGTTSSGDTGVTVRDSAGIRIVENHDSAWTAETRWRLADEPDLRIGSLDGSVPGTDFGNRVRAQFLGDQIVVADLTSDEFRLFDGNGTYVRTLNRRGEGPTEFQSLSTSGTVGDSVVIGWDFRMNKLVRFDVLAGTADGQPFVEPPVEVESTFPIPGISPWRVSAFFPDGSYLVTSQVFRGTPPAGDTVYSLDWHHMAADGAHLGMLGTFPSRWSWSNGDVSGSVPLTSGGIVEPGDGVVWQAFPLDAFAISRRSLTGEPEVEIRLDWPLEAPGDALVRAMDRATLESSSPFGDNAPPGVAESFAERQQQVAEHRPLPDVVSPFSGLVPSPSGYLWAELYEPLEGFRDDLGESEQPPSPAWIVIDPDGRWLGTIEARPGFVLTDLGDDHVLGYRRDEFDVPYVERYPIITP